MASVKELAQKLDQLKKKDENKQCFDCGEKGTTYVCINFGTFICSRCAGILRELNFKVKGISVSIFNQKEIDILTKNGNANAKKIWLAKYKENREGAPNVKDDDAFRNFLNKKYKDKKWYKAPKGGSGDDEDGGKKKSKKDKKKKDESSDEESEESEDEKKSKKKDNKKKDNKKKKEESSDEESEDDDSDSDDDEEEKKKE